MPIVINLFSRLCNLILSPLLAFLKVVAPLGFQKEFCSERKMKTKGISLDREINCPFQGFPCFTKVSVSRNETEQTKQNETKRNYTELASFDETSEKSSKICHHFHVFKP
jgi:hypothetical protein